MQTALLGRTHPARRQTERMVRDVYRDAYGADIDGFPGLMAAVLDRSGRPLCAAGLRTAITGFFSACYLDAPVGASISAAAREPVDVSQVVEVTTLAAARRGLSLTLVKFVIEQGRAHGMRWGLFTATAPLRRALSIAGLRPYDLALATPSRVADPQSWGSYYRTRPRVCAIADPLRCPESRIERVESRRDGARLLGVAASA